MNVGNHVTQYFTVYTYDIDYAGHVSNITYLRWLETLRYLLLEHSMPLDMMMKKGYLPVVARTEIHYRTPIYLFEKPKGALWVHRTGTVKYTVKAEFTVEHRLCTEATHDIAFISRKTLKPVKIARLLSQIE